MQEIDARTILRQLESLPPSKQQEAADFISFLHSRLPVEEVETRSENRCRLSDDPFVGMWRDRVDMQDGAEWVRNLRGREWENESA
jgi:hypothetical protein